MYTDPMNSLKDCKSTAGLMDKVKSRRSPLIPRQSLGLWVWKRRKWRILSSSSGRGSEGLPESCKQVVSLFVRITTTHSRGMLCRTILVATPSWA